MDIVRRKPLSKGSTGDKISVKRFGGSTFVLISFAAHISCFFFILSYLTSRFIPPKTSHLHYSHLKWTMCQGQERQMNREIPMCIPEY
ncbi:hypothetical protein RND81_06G084700 [Saponaria officinalis]|uniref:Transmembrane protein n=1 Tax=Saponaria officinalis TaxID=3572 RepID=A0AAW1K8Z8_SAPOF